MQNTQRWVNGVVKGPEQEMEVIILCCHWILMLMCAQWLWQSLYAASEQLNKIKLNCLLSVQYLCYSIMKFFCSHYGSLSRWNYNTTRKKILYPTNNIGAIVIILRVNCGLIFHWYKLI